MITKLHPTDLIAVQVPGDATEVHRSGYEILGEINKDKISVDHNDNIDLRKLLKENGLYFKNPYQEDWDELCTWGHGDFSKYGKTSSELYFEAQEKLVKGKLIILKPIL